MKLSNKILLGLFMAIIILQFGLMMKFRSLLADSVNANSQVNQSILYDLTKSEVVEKSYNIDNFSEMELNFNGNIIIEKADQYAITVKAPIDLQESDYFTLQKKRKTLKINFPAYEFLDTDIDVIVKTPRLDELTLKNRINVKLLNFKQKKFELESSGFCTVYGKNNEFTYLSLDTFGSNDIDFSKTKVIHTDIRSLGETDLNLETETLEIEGFGENDYELKMNGGTLSGTIIGHADIEYYGTIEKNRLKFIGNGKVNQR